MTEHPITEDTYELLPDGTVRVEEHVTGHAGIFGPGAKWISGELRHADQQMIQFLIDRAKMAPQA